MYALTTRSLLLLAFVAGCVDPQAEDTDDTDPIDTDTDAPEAEICDDGLDNDADGQADCADQDCLDHADCSEVTPGPFWPYAFTVSSGFGYDAATGTLVDVTWSESAIEPWVSVQLYEEAWFDGSSPADACQIVIRHEGDALAVQGWSFTDTYDDTETIALEHAGLELPDNSRFATDCTGAKGLDPGWGDVDDVLAWTWGAGVGEPRPDAQRWIDTNIDAADRKYYGGGGMYLEMGGDYTAAAVSRAYAVDGSFGLVTEGGKAVTMDRATWVTTSGVPAKDGYYETYGTIVFLASYLVP